MKKQLFKTRDELIKWLETVNTPTEAMIVVRTYAKLNKTSRIDRSPNPFYGKVVKHSVYDVKLGVLYENEVNKQRLEENRSADFKSQSAWYYHPTDTVNHTAIRSIVRHKRTNLPYMFSKLEIKGIHSYLDLSNNQIIDVHQLEEYMGIYKPQPGRQGLVNKVQPLIVKIDNVVSIETKKLLIRVIK